VLVTPSRAKPRKSSPSKRPSKPVKSSTPPKARPPLTPPKTGRGGRPKGRPGVKAGPTVRRYYEEAVKLRKADAAERERLEALRAREAAEALAKKDAQLAARRARDKARRQKQAAELRRRERELAAAEAEFKRKEREAEERDRKRQEELDRQKAALPTGRELVADIIGIQLKSAEERCNDYLRKLRREGRDFDPRDNEDIDEARRIAIETGESVRDVFSTLMGSPPGDFGIAA
jgi:hypothetical protein